MRFLHFALALSIGLLSCGQLQAAFLLENTTGKRTDSQIDKQNDWLGTPTGMAKEYGLVFQVKNTSDPLSVTALGFFDHDPNGLSESHKVQLFQMTSAQNNPGVYTLIAQATVPQTIGGDNSNKIGEFRYASLASPVTLSPGGTYILLAQYGTQNGNAPLDMFGQFGDLVSNVANGGPLNDQFVPKTASQGTTGLGLVKTSIDTQSFTVGVSTLLNPGNPVSTFIQPGENFPFLVNLQFGTAGAVPEPSTFVVWSVLGVLGFVFVFKRQYRSPEPAIL